MTSSNHISKVAVVGAGANCGKHIAAALIAAGKHTVTAVTREDSTTELPSGLHAVKEIDYENPLTLVAAFEGQDAVVITLSGYATSDAQEKLIEAAVEAGVRYILPNEWSPDTANESLVNDVFPFASKPKARQQIISKGGNKTQYIAMTTGFWYEWSLAIAPAYGFDFANKSVTFFDDGETVINTSTWPQIGRAVAALLSLPILPVKETKGCLSDFGNQQVYISSFAVSQKDIFESVLRVTQTVKRDWSTTYEPSKQRYANGLGEIKQGNKIGFAKMMYTRVFYQDGSGNYGKSKGTLNTLLGLPHEDLDEFTALAIERSKGPQWAH
ncbi:NAD(P)-binding protein, partial [Aureobasidium melanogenum]